MITQPMVKSASDPNDGVCDDGEGWGCIAEIASEDHHHQHQNHHYDDDHHHIHPYKHTHHHQHHCHQHQCLKC